MGVHSLQKSLDTISRAGKLAFHFFAALAEFERDVTQERTRAGLSAARARGRQGGKPKGRNTSKQLAAQALSQDKNRPVGEIWRMLGISCTGYYHYINSDL